MAIRQKRSFLPMRNLWLSLLCLLSFGFAQAQPSIPGYTGLGVFNGHYYYISETKYFGTDISTAVADARAKVLAIEPSRPAGDVYAAAILNQAENDFITNAVVAYNINKYGGNGKSTFENWGAPQNPWIGLTDAASEGNFVWSNGQPSCQDYRNWNTGEPNNYTGPVSNGEDYTQMLIMNPYYFSAADPNHDPLGKWNDWFNSHIISPDGVDLGPTQLAVIIEVGPADCSFNLSLSSKTNVSCFGDDNGTATFTIAGGTSPFTYVLDADPASAPFTTSSFTVNELSAGNHTIVVTDATNIAKSLDFSISQPAAPLEASGIVVTNVSCNGGSNGSVTISATGGTAPYTGTGTFNNLTAGDHSFTVVDKNGCQDEVTVTISQPAKLNVNAAKTPSCNGNNGSVTITATGGTQPYTGTGTFGGLAPGNYNYTVTDAKGCTASIAVTIDGTVGGFNPGTETFPSQFNTYFTTSLYNRTFTGSTGTWTVNSNSNATMAVLQPYYAPSSSYALKVLNFKTTYCGAGTTSAASPKLNLTGPCCPAGVKLNFTLWTYAVVYGDSKAALEIDFSNDNGATWTEVWSKTSGQLYSSYGANGKTTISIPVPTTYQNSNFRYRIRGEMMSGDCNNFYVFIDDINVTSPSVCAATSSIGNFVWNDLNRNGKQDFGEPGLANVNVKLTLPGGATQTTTTNASGYYSFTGLDAGTYTLTFTTPAGFTPATANLGGDDELDSDPVNGSVTVNLLAGQTNNSVDAAYAVTVCTNTTNHTETFPNQFNTWFYTSLYNKTFAGTSGTWTVNSNSYATMVGMVPPYSPSSTYALKVVNYKTSGCGNGWSKAVSPKVDLSNPCCPSELKLKFSLWTYKVAAYDSKAALEIDFSRDNGATWTEVWSKTSGQLYSSYGCGGKTTISIPVASTYQTANFRYRIRGEMMSGDCNYFYVFIDDINIGSPASCTTSTYSARGGAGIASSDESADNNATDAKAPVESATEIVAEFGATVFPNPSPREFELRFTSKDKAPASINIVDAQGRTVKTMTLAPNQSIRFGADFRSGNYVAVVTQGDKKQVIKLIKF